LTSLGAVVERLELDCTMNSGGLLTLRALDDAIVSFEASLRAVVFVFVSLLRFGFIFRLEELFVAVPATYCLEFVLILLVRE
jgi:hypothetical protein